jgi:hypothetical protein
VVAETDQGFQVIINSDELEECEKKVELFQQKLDLALKSFTIN